MQDKLNKLRCSWRVTVLTTFLAIMLGLFCLPLIGFAASPVIQVVMDDSYPPYVFREPDGKLAGILVDQWALWSAKTGVRAEIAAMDWAEALARMQAGQYDVIDTIFRNPEREKIYDFSKPHVRLDALIFFRQTVSGITGIPSLRGFNVGVKRGDHAVTVLKQAGITSLVEYDSYEAMILAARDKSLLVFVMDKPPALYYLYKYSLQDEIRFSGPLYFGEFHQAVRKGDDKMLQLVEAGFAKISPEEYAAIDRKWFGASSVVNPPDYRPLAALAVSVILVGLMLLAWNWLLRRTVRVTTRELAASEEKFRNLLMNLSIGVVVHDSSGAPTYWNRSALRQLHLSAEQLAGTQPCPAGWVFISDEGFPLAPEQFPASLVLAAGEALRGYAMGLRRPGDRCRWFEVDAFPEFDPDHRIVQVVVTFVECTARREAENNLRFISFHDALTGTYNRAYFEEELRRLDGRREGAAAIVVADVDGMKEVNDTYGHLTGDQLLIRAARLLQGSVRQEDVVARIGGDEFAVIFRNADTPTLDGVCERIRQLLDQEETDATTTPLRLSFGYALGGGPEIAAATLFKEADGRMYEEKKRKRGIRF